MRKNLLALFVAGLLLSSPALAAGPVVIAVVDGEKLITQSVAGKAAIAELQRLKDAKQKEISAKEATAKSTKASLDAKGASLSEDARRAQELKLLSPVTPAGRLFESDPLPPDFGVAPQQDHARAGQNVPFAPAIDFAFACSPCDTVGQSSGAVPSSQARNDPVFTAVPAGC